jgi:cytochrome c-type protein NapB
MRRQVPLLFATILLLAAPSVDGDQPMGTPDAQIGLAKGSIFDVLVPDPVNPETSDPGDKRSAAPEFDGSPPRVPHAIDDYLPVTREDNLCVDCHGIAAAEVGDPTPIPASHYIDLRRAPDRVGETLAGARWVCLSCHVAPTDTKPLVRNLFVRPGPAVIGDEEPR